MSNEQDSLPPGTIEVRQDPEVGVRFALPQEWFTLPELRSFAAYLTVVADENEPSPEVDELAAILETACLVTQGPRALARALHAAGCRLVSR